jgi:hypothetical protein
MLLTIEISLIHREGIDKLFDLVVGVRPHDGEIRLERLGPGGTNSLDQATIDVIALVVVEQHSGAAIEKFAQTPNVLRGNVDGTGSVGL